MTRPDPHSSFDDAQPRVRHVSWRARLDFGARSLIGEVRLLLAAPTATARALDLDTRELVIERVSDDDGAPLGYELGAAHPILGQRLRVHLPDGASAVRIRYRTQPSSPALCWANDFVYSQCQPINARALLPLPDSPSSRITFDAELTTPSRAGWQPLMAAELVEQHDAGADTISTWRMPVPIAPHLIALACGALRLVAEQSPRVRIWSAAALSDDARRALVDVEQLVVAAEALFGPYRWGHFHVLVMPRSFPHGGMENPGLTFVSPSLRGDALLHVVAHELAHAWTGNLVANASLEHFWINEGFTVFAERRILAAVRGRDFAERHAALGRRELERALVAFASRPELTKLRTHLDGIDPEDALSIVPYEKGYLFLRALEDACGRDAIDGFLRALVETFAWQSITTETLRAFAEPRLTFADWDAWLNQPGLPASAPPPLPPPPTDLPDRETAQTMTALEWRWFLDGLPRPWPHCATLAQLIGPRLDLAQHDDADVRVAWLALAIESDHALDDAVLDAALDSGRLKELRPLYLALVRNGKTKPRAGELYRRHMSAYHPAARRQLEQLLRDFGVATHVANPLGLGKRRT